jgi:hypothetical protein
MRNITELASDKTYFRLFWKQKAPSLLEHISGVLKKLDPPTVEE